MALRDVDAKRARALSLHLQGVTYEAIAGIVGYSGRAGAYKAVQAALAQRPDPGRVEALRTEAARLDMVLTALSSSVEAGDPKSAALFLVASKRRTEVAEAMTAAPPAEDGSGEVRNPIDELNARRANRGTARGAARGSAAPGARQSDVLPD